MYPKSRGEEDIFFPSTTSQEAVAKTAYCFPCKVRTQCEEKANDIGAQYGIWGGEKRTRYSDSA